MAIDGSLATESGGGGSSPAPPYIWTADEGLMSVKEYLEDELGLDLTGWQLDTITDLSRSGRFVLGNGVDPQGQARYWMADLFPVPEPGSLRLLVPGLLLLMILERRSRRKR